MMALAASGREVSLEELALWRKNGLLPPLASYGMRSQGRTYYWDEPDILARAELIHDALCKHGRSETATISLWLHGFEVPPSRLKRAWLQRARLAAQVRIRPANGGGDLAGACKTLPELLLSASLHAAVSVECIPDRAFPALNRAAAALGCAPGRDSEAQLYWRALMAMLPALCSSDAISSASEEQMLEAQRYLHIGLKFLSGYCRDESPAGMTESVGPPLFLFILALLRSGQQTVIQAVMNRIADVRNKAAPFRQAGIPDGGSESQPVASYL